MAERQPSTREIRSVLRDMEKEPDFDKDPEETLRRLASRFPNLPSSRAIEAFNVHLAVARRTVAREELEAHRATAVMKCLSASSYANLNEAAADLGLFDLQEVWDYVMEEAGLPPSTAPETVQIE